MNTPSHIIINAALGRKARLAGPRLKGWLWGAITPDLPLYALTLLGIFYYAVIKGQDLEFTNHEIFHNLYFTNPFWKAAHNFFHAPFVLAAIAGLGWRFRQTRWGLWWLWFAGGATIHTTIDLLTHVDDGPLIFFPFNWNLRFQAPISYWDPRFHGQHFFIFEMILNLVLLGYLFVTWRRSRQQKPEHETRL